MNDFIARHPEFEEKLRVFNKINEISYSEIEEKINRYLDPICIKYLLKLNKYFKHCKKEERLLLKKSYLYIANNESERVESLIYRVICGNSILIEDIEHLIMFYAYLNEYCECFVVINNDLKLFNMYLKKKFAKVDISNEFLEATKNFKTTEKIFYFLIFGQFFGKNPKHILDFFEELDKSSLNDLYQNYQYEILRFLPKDEFYKKMGSLILYCDIPKAIKILKFVDINDNNQILCAILHECFCNKVLIRKVFLHFINLLNSFGIDIRIKLLVLHSWLRFFLYEKFIPDFFDIMKKLKQIEADGLEFKVFLAFENYFLNKGTIEDVEYLSKKAGETNKFAKHKFRSIIKKYK